MASFVPDGLGNTAFLFEDTNYCEHLLVQVQQDDGDPGTANPIIGLDNGVSAAVSFDLVVPMDAPKIGGVIIDEPAALAKEFKGAVVVDHLFNASDWVATLAQAAKILMEISPWIAPICRCALDLECPWSIPSLLISSSSTTVRPIRLWDAVI